MALLFAILGGLPRTARADQVIEGEVSAEGAFFLVPFEVPAGTREIEVRHPKQFAEGVLDYGLLDPVRFRGWGGGNSEPFIVGDASASRSYLPGEMPAGTWNVIIGKALIVETPTRYRLEIMLRTEPTLAPAPERAPYQPVVLASTGPRWFAGDFHVHSRQSGDANATFEEIAELATSRGLDFVEISDHNTNAQLDFFDDVQSRHPDLLFMPGAEITTYAGHANGIGVEHWIDHRLGVDGNSMARIAGAVGEVGGVFAINHPVLDVGAQCIGCLWESEVPVELIGAVEIATGAGAFLFSEDTLAFWDELSQRGAHASAIGGSDDHRAGRDTGPLASRIGSPTTMVYAEELGARAIIEGVRLGRTVVKLRGPDDPMIEISVGGAVPSGVVVAEETTLEARVTGAFGGSVRWLENGREAAATAITSDPFVFSVTARAPAQGEDRWRAEVAIDGTLCTVTSNVFIRAAEPVVAGCGCSSTSGGQSGAIWILVFIALTGCCRSAGRTSARSPIAARPTSGANQGVSTSRVANGSSPPKSLNMAANGCPTTAGKRNRPRLATPPSQIPIQSRRVKVRLTAIRSRAP